MGLSWLVFPSSFPPFWSVLRSQTKLAGLESAPLASLLQSSPMGCCGVSTLCLACEQTHSSAAVCTQCVSTVGEIGHPKPFYAPTCRFFITGLKHSTILPPKCLASELFSNQYCSLSVCIFQLNHYLFVVVLAFCIVSWSFLILTIRLQFHSSVLSGLSCVMLVKSQCQPYCCNSVHFSHLQGERLKKF